MFFPYLFLLVSALRFFLPKFRRPKSLIYEWLFSPFFTWAKSSFSQDGCDENILIYMVLDRLEQLCLCVKIKNCQMKRGKIFHAVFEEVPFLENVYPHGKRFMYLEIYFELPILVQSDE